MIEYWNSSEDITKISEFVSGSDKSFAELVNKYQNSLFSLCLRMLGNQAEAEDIVQDTFLRFMTYVRSGRKIEKCGSWLYTVALNQCRKSLKRRKVVRMLSFGLIDEIRYLEPVDYGESPEIETEKRDSIDRIVGLLPKLSVKLREPIVLRYFQRILDEDAAKLLNTSIENYRLRLSRASQQLKHLFEEKP